MTQQTTIDQLTPEELRVEIAESRGWMEIELSNVMHLSGMPAGKDMFGKWPGWPRGNTSGYVPNYPTDANAALTLAAALAEKGWSNAHDEKQKGRLIFKFYKKCKETEYLHEIIGHASTFALALSRAYLAVIRSEVKP